MRTTEGGCGITARILREFAQIPDAFAAAARFSLSACLRLAGLAYLRLEKLAN